MKFLASLFLFFSISGYSANPRFIYAICEREFGNLEVFINTLENWEQYGNLTDSYTKEERKLVVQITSDVTMCELAESTYEPCGKYEGAPRNVMEAALDALDPELIQYHEEFQEFIGRECEY
ncbi:MAG: hypothetical protein H6621_10175 [Halobacteriovoraceae bacterium]|nr:hypothetical protein [Halobacteriovoraceae bacterium]MCB9095423.1 hypothetical protein [Halobacteriovoraceae bacterium]